jgi:putative sterol carrier protein
VTEDLAVLFAEADLTAVDAVDIARLIAETSEETLRAAEGGQLRARVLAEVFRRLPDYARPERIGDLRAAVHWELPAPEGTEHYGIHFEDGRIRIERTAPANPRVSLRCDAVSALRAVTGNANPALMVLTGTLTLTGDERFAVEMLACFTMPTADGTTDAPSPTAVDAEQIAAVVAKTDPGDLRARLRGGVREILVDEVIRRLPGYVDPEAAADVTALVGWEILDEHGHPDRFLLHIDHGHATAGRDLTGTPEVTLRLDTADFLALATGNADPSTLVLSGDLVLDGDAATALAMVRFLRIPSADGVAEVGDPAQVDVARIVKLVATTSDRDLKKRLTGPVRQILLDEIFRRMPQYLNESRAAGVDALVAWQITGATSGGYDEYRTRISGGRATAGTLPGKPKVSIRADPVLFFKLVTGNLNPVTAFLTRRLSIRGDLMFAGRLPSIFTIPRG